MSWAMRRAPACVVVVALWSATAWGQEAKPPETHTVAAGPFKVDVTLQGVFESSQMTEVALRPDAWSSLIVDKAVPQGTKVEQGQVILWLETDKIDNELKTTKFSLDLGKLSLAQSQLELATLEASVPLDLRDAEQAKEIADRTLAHYLKTDEEMSRRSAAESLKNSEYSLEYAQEELNQLEQMYKADDLTEQTEEIILKRARRDVERGQFFLENARIRNERTINEDIPRQKESHQETAARAALALEKAQATLPRSLEQKFAELQKDRERMELKAPAAGIVYYGSCERGSFPASATVAKQLRKGGVLSPNQVVMTILTPGSSFVRVDIPEKDLRHVKPGTAGTVTPTAFPDARLPARVAAIDPIPIKDGTFDGKIEYQMEAGQLPLQPAMNCSVKLTAYSKPDALTVPASAVFSDDLDETKKHVYFAKEEGKHEKRDVKVGLTSGDKTEIVSGLAAGDKILLKKP
jgi:multidrug efflux pump subunit AcrA (membrane-fusion protein)